MLLEEFLAENTSPLDPDQSNWLCSLVFSPKLLADKESSRLQQR